MVVLFGTGIRLEGNRSFILEVPHKYPKGGAKWAVIYVDLEQLKRKKRQT